MATGKFVAYYRVSTARQGRSGLGLEAQQGAVRDYLNGGGWQLVSEHTEVESGSRSDRPELAAALQACRIHKATLVVAKLDRLSRDAGFLITLRDGDVDVLAVDMPEMNKMVVGIMAVVAQHEREAISARTKAALAAAKARGVRLGGGSFTRKAARKGAAASRAVRGAQADQRARDLFPTLSDLRSRMTWREVAAELERRGIPLPRGAWDGSRALKLYRRGEALQG